MTGRLTKIHSPLEISSKPLRGPPPLLAIFCLHPTADLPAVQTTTKPEVLHQGEKQYSFHSLRPNLSWLPHRPHQWRSIEGQGNSLTRPPRCVCWYYWQTVWLCLSECDDRTKHWYLPCDNRRVWTGSVQKRGVWDWQSVCVCVCAEAWCTVSVISAWVCLHTLWWWLRSLHFIFWLCWAKTPQR